MPISSLWIIRKLLFFLVLVLIYFVFIITVSALYLQVADFGLTKLTEVGSASLPTRLVGTFGYMPPE